MDRGALFLGFILTLLAAAGGCQANRPKVASAEAPAVPVSHALQREVTDFVDFTGRTEAVHSVDIRPRVTGYLVKMPFKEGAEVKEGDLLFVVDPRPYKAQVDQAQGQVDLYQASLKLAKTTLARDRAINSLSPGSVSKQQFDQEQATVDEADARVKAYEKSHGILQAQPRIHPDHIADRRPDQPLLPDSRQPGQPGPDALDHGRVDGPHVRLLRDGRAHAATDPQSGQRRERSSCPRTAKLPVLMGLQGEEGFPHTGTINFVNNQVNPATGSILVRGVFPNPKPKVGTRLLSPGMFVRIRMPIGQSHPALLVIDRAVGSDQGLKYVYVVDAENKAQYQRVTTGGAAGRRHARDRARTQR